MRRTLIAVAALLFLAGASICGYALGHRSLDQDAIYADGYGAGEKAGTTQGHIEGFTDGQRTARRSMRFVDRQVARQHRREVTRAFSAGWNAVFESFGSWAPGGFYIVQIDRGSDVSYQLRSRLEMRANELYSLCPDGTGICGGG